MPVSLSVCMIVRDEERVIERCLDSIAGLYDELCVVDTGSVDRTGERLRRYGAWVRVDTSCNGADGRIADFAMARNAALAMATGDWILQIDADEVLESGHALLRSRIESSRGSIGVRMRWDDTEWISARLFRRADARTYRSAIHEYLECVGGFAIERGIVIRNLPDKTGKEASRERNIRLLRAQLERHPDDARLWYFLGVEQQLRGEIAAAETAYARALEIGSYRHGLYHTAYYLGCCRLILGKLEQALHAAERAIAIDPRYAEAHCLAGDLHHLCERLEQARACYQRALACGAPPADALFAVQRWAYDEHPRCQIAQIDAHMSTLSA